MGRYPYGVISNGYHWMWVISFRCHEQCDILRPVCGWWKYGSLTVWLQHPPDTWGTIGYHWYMECRKPCLAKAQNHLGLLKVASATLWTTFLNAQLKGIFSQIGKHISQTWDNQKRGQGIFTKQPWQSDKISMLKWRAVLFFEPSSSLET